MKKFFLFQVVLFITVSCHAFEFTKYVSKYAKRQGDKVYLSPEVIDLSTNTISFVVGDCKIPLSYLSSDDFGLYVKAKDFEQNFNKNIAFCSNCRSHREYNWNGRCTICGTIIAPGF